MAPSKDGRTLDVQHRNFDCGVHIDLARLNLIEAEQALLDEQDLKAAIKLKQAARELTEAFVCLHRAQFERIQGGKG